MQQQIAQSQLSKNDFRHRLKHTATYCLSAVQLVNSAINSGTFVTVKSLYESLIKLLDTADLG